MNIEASAPDTVTLGVPVRFNADEPVFSMVNVSEDVVVSMVLP